MRKGSGRRVGSLATGRNDHMTAAGTKRTYRDDCYLAAFGSKADISPRLPNNRNL